MPNEFQATNAIEGSMRNRVLIRLDTLIRLRWYAIVGQVSAVGVIAFGFGYAMPWLICLLLIAASAALNLWLAQRYKVSHRLPDDNVFSLLAFDVLQLGLLLYLTGGLQNPFAILLIAPVVVSSTSLRQGHIKVLGGLAIVVITILAFDHYPLPWDANEAFSIPFLYSAGVWVAMVCTLAFTAIYAFRVAEEARKLADALASTELVLQREQHLSALDGLAAAAAHELGTPLATIALVSKEMLHALPDDGSMREDASLLRSQAERCREILQKLSSLSSSDESIVQRETLAVLVEQEVEPLRDFGVDIQVRLHGEMEKLPEFNRSPAIHYALGNLIDNAVDFARNQVLIDLHWDDSSVRIEISDDGPGFPPSLIDKLGEPFVTNRTMKDEQEHDGLGLGLFIAKTLLERNGAEIAFERSDNDINQQTGAFVSVTWELHRLVG